MLKKAMIIVAALITMAGAAQAQAPEETMLYNLQEFQPTKFHEAIYGMIAYCTGVRGDYGAVRWYVASTLADRDGTEYWGLWTEGWGWPAIILDRQKVFDGEVVSHEIMHDLYKGQGPMDKYRACVLEWRNLTPIISQETPNAEDRGN